MDKITLKTTLLAQSLLIAMAGTSLQVLAGEDKDESARKSIEVIVVTGEKTERSIKDTAASVAVVNQALLDSGGMAALVPQKPGPRRAHKLDPEVMAFIEQLRSEDASLRAADLAGRVQKRFRRKVHPRSIERALARQEKKRP